jgi:hypothetical protein
VSFALDGAWSRIDQGYGLEALRHDESVTAQLAKKKAIRLRVFERCLEGEFKGLIRMG